MYNVLMFEKYQTCFFVITVTYIKGPHYIFFKWFLFTYTLKMVRLQFEPRILIWYYTVYNVYIVYSQCTMYNAHIIYVSGNKVFQAGRNSRQ